MFRDRSAHIEEIGVFLFLIIAQDHHRITGSQHRRDTQDDNKAYDWWENTWLMQSVRKNSLLPLHCLRNYHENSENSYYLTLYS